MNSDYYNNILLTCDNYEEKFLQIAYLKLTKFKQAQLYGNGENGLNLLLNRTGYISVNASNIDNIKGLIVKSDISMKIKKPIFLTQNLKETENEVFIEKEADSELILDKRAIYQLHYNKIKNNIEISNPWYKIYSEPINEETIKNIACIIVNK